MCECLAVIDSIINQLVFEVYISNNLLPELEVVNFVCLKTCNVVASEQRGETCTKSYCHYNHTGVIFDVENDWPAVPLRSC